MTRPKWLVSLLFAVAIAGPAFSNDEPPAPVLFVKASTSGSGIRVGPPTVSIPSNVLGAIRTASATTRIDLAVTIYPDQADYILVLELNQVRAAAYQNWTLVDAVSGIILRRGRRRGLRSAVNDVVEALGRQWYSRLQDPPGS